MPLKTPLTQLSLVGLAYRCRHETERFWQKRPYDPQFCYELFRRALTDPHAESSKQTWAFIHRQYRRQVTIWVKKHRLFPQTGVEPEMLADLALEKMWLSFANTPEKFGRFPARVDSCLPALLRFLQTCVHSVVMDTLETPSAELDLATAVAAPLETERLESEAFWECIYKRLRSDKERLVMDASFVHGLKPRHIYQMYEDQFENVKEIHRLKENILARFKRDASLRDCLGEEV